MKRWPIIRHIRWLYLAWKYESWWMTEGHHLGAVQNLKDWEFLEQVRKGGG